MFPSASTPTIFPPRCTPEERCRHCRSARIAPRPIRDEVVIDFLASIFTCFHRLLTASSTSADRVVSQTLPSEICRVTSSRTLDVPKGCIRILPIWCRDEVGSGQIVIKEDARRLELSTCCAIISVWRRNIVGEQGRFALMTISIPVTLLDALGPKVRVGSRAFEECLVQQGAICHVVTRLQSVVTPQAD